LVIVTVGLGGALATARIGRVVRLTLIGLSPGGSGDLVRDTSRQQEGARAALWLGLAFAVTTLAMALGQVERGEPIGSTALSRTGPVGGRTGWRSPWPS
jgi:hypothetical protein